MASTISRGSGSRQPAAGSENVPASELDALLAPIRDASYTRNRKTSPPDSDCLPGTRTNVIRRLTAWVNTSVLLNTVHILWLHGYVGCGKSAISQAVSQKFGRKGRLLASFFFYRNAGDRSKMNKFAVTLASQMVAAVPATEPFVKAAVKAESGLVTGEVSLAIQLERLVYKPFNAVVKRGLILKTLFQGPFLVVIDGLDECEDKEEVKEFINHLLDFFKRHPSTPLRFFITSRVEQHIKECLNTAGVQLDDLVAHGSEDDILTFLETSFRHRVERDPVLAAYVLSNGQWPTRADLKTLVRHIGGSFVFASALFKYIVEPSDDGLNPITRLPLTLDMNPGLDGLYAFTVARSQRLPHFSEVISTIALVFEPLSITAIAGLLGIQTFEVLHILVNLQAIIHIPGTDELPVTFCHTSFHDFLTTESRSRHFFARPSHHLYLSYCCSLVQDKPERENAAASYGIGNCENHFKQFASLPPSLQDALYAHILAKASHHPHFFDIISTIALLITPLSSAGIAELLSINSSEIVQVVINLQPLIKSELEVNNPSVPMCRKSLHDFLTTESRSRPFFTSPSYHLKIYYRCLGIVLKRQLNETLYSPAREYSWAGCIAHLNKFLEGTSEQCILEAFEQLPHIPNWQPLPKHLLPFTHIFYWLFADYHCTRPKDVFHAITRCIEFLALALECDPKPDRWLHGPLSELGLPGPSLVELFTSRSDYYLEIRQEQAAALQHIIERVETAIRAKYPSVLSESQLYLNTEACVLRDLSMYIQDWTPISTYRLFEWMNRRVQAEITLDEPGSDAPCYFALHFLWEWNPPKTRVTLRRLRSSNSRPEVSENGGD